jgi:hypothetical protein
MKTTEKTGLKRLLLTFKMAMLALAMLVLLCMPQRIQTAHAQGHSYHNNSFNGMAAIAEKESRTKKQKANEVDKHNEVNIATGIAVDAENEKEHVTVPDKTTSSEK